MADTFLGIRHGPLSFLNEETAIIYFLSSERKARRYELDLIKSISSKGLGKSRTVVGYDLEHDIEGLDVERIELARSAGQKIEDGLRPPLDVIAAQVMALKLSLELGLDPDNPSPRGVISRVVEGVKIYG